MQWQWAFKISLKRQGTFVIAIQLFFSNCLALAGSVRQSKPKVFVRQWVRGSGQDDNVVDLKTALTACCITKDDNEEDDEAENAARAPDIQATPSWKHLSYQLHLDVLGRTKTPNSNGPKQENGWCLLITRGWLWKKRLQHGLGLWFGFAKICVLTSCRKSPTCHL